MTKHMYQDEGGMRVDVGWERGRQMFYLTLYAATGRIVYDSDLERGALTLAFIESVMTRHNLVLRADVRAALVQDQAVDAAPYMRHYDQALSA